MTFLDMVNDVLVRLREPIVITTSDTPYSSLIASMVRDAKVQVEDAFSWNALGTYSVVNTVPGVSEYILENIGSKFQITDAINATSNLGLVQIPFATMNRYLNFSASATVQGIPQFYNIDGLDPYSTFYDVKFNVYPIPDAVYSLRFSLIAPQADFANDYIVPLVPSKLIVQNAYARALVERGEDGGLNSSEAYALYKSMLADYIALEATRTPENMEFIAV